MNDDHTPLRIFVVGCPRSGTTLLQRLLSEHGALLTLPETAFFDRMLNDLPQRMRIAPPRRSQRLHDLLGTVSGRGWRRSVRDLIDIARRVDVPLPPLRRGLLPRRSELSRAFVATLDAGAKQACCNGWLEKTPNHLAYLDVISEQVPGARFVHIVRAGHDVLTSILNARLRYHNWPLVDGFKGDLVHWARHWNWCLWQHWSYAGHPCHRVVFHEDLVTDPAGELERLLVWLGIGASKSGVRGQVADVAEEPWKIGAVSGAPSMLGKEPAAMFGADLEGWLARGLLPYQAMTERIRLRQAQDDPRAESARPPKQRDAVEGAL